MKYDVLIVEDEDDIRTMIGGILEDDGYEVRLTAKSDEAITALRSRKPSLMILDVWLKGSSMDGIELLDSIKKSHPNMPIIIISGHGTVETAVSAIRKGAYDYITKPFDINETVKLVEKASNNLRQAYSQDKIKYTKDVSKIIGMSESMQVIYKSIISNRILNIQDRLYEPSDLVRKNGFETPKSRSFIFGF